MELPTNQNTTGVLLSGGQGKRMGYCKKHELTMGEKSFLSISLDALEGFHRRAISTKTDLLAPIDGVEQYEDLLDIGPLGGIYTALKQCETPNIFVLTCDIPYVKKEFVNFMLGQMKSGNLGVFPVIHNRVNVLCGVYSKELLPHIEARIPTGRYAVIGAIETAPLQYVDITGTEYEKMLFNVNTKAEYESITQP